jgi:cell division transport system permease protein
MYSVKEAFLSVKRAGLMNFISMLTVMVTLLVLGVFLIISENLSERFSFDLTKIELIAFLDEDVRGTKRIQSIRDRIEALAVSDSVFFVPRDVALEEFRESLREDAELLDGVIDNPLPDSFHLTLESENGTKAVVDTVVRSIEKIEGISNVFYPEHWLAQIEDVVRHIAFIDLSIAILFCCITFLVISNTIRLTVIARREHIEIMKLVGATYSFILRPFILEGFLHGFIGGLLSLLLLFLFYCGIRTKFEDIVFVSNADAAGLIVFGSFVGFLSGYIAARRYVRI